MENQSPLYQISLSKKRILIPKMFTLIFLSSLFYLGIRINITLLQLDPKTKQLANIAGIVIVIFLFILGIILNYFKAKQGIKFFSDHLKLGHQKINYLSLN